MLRILVIDTHLLVAKFIVRLLSGDPELVRLLFSPAIAPWDAVERGEPCLFIVDLGTLSLELSAVVRTLRLRCPASKFLVLLHAQADGEEILRLLWNGIEGVVVPSEKVEEELPAAVHAILDGNLWAPQRVLSEYVHLTNLLLDQQLVRGCSLTGREYQILQLMIRRLSNKEIAGAMGIAERTVRFHVSNVFAKLRVRDRRGLLPALVKLTREPA